MILFNQPLNQSILDIEEKNRSNIFTWRGQFSPQLIESLLNAYCDHGEVILDPFSGSGTVLFEAGKKGLECYGCEINPAAWMFSKIYEFMNVPLKNRRSHIYKLRNALSQEFSDDIFQEYRYSNGEIEQVIDKIGVFCDDKEKMILNTLMILLDLYNHHHTGGSIRSKFDDLSSLILSLPESQKPIKAYLKDSRNMPLENGKIGFIVTSPPYINVFNYHQNYRKSAESLGWDLLKVARSEIGSNRANRGNRFLTVIQYCFDMAVAISECERVLKKGGKAIFIVGYESNVLGVPFYNAKIIQEIIHKIPSFQIRQIQVRSFKNKFGKNIQENLIHFEKMKREKSSSPVLMDEVGKIAEEVLIASLEVVPEKNTTLLRQAIDQTTKIKSTPVFYGEDYKAYHTKEFVMVVNEGVE